MAIDLSADAIDRAFESQYTGMSYEEYRSQEVLETNDGEFFDALDEAFGIVPRTDTLAEA